MQERSFKTEDMLGGWDGLAVSNDVHVCYPA